MTAVELQRLTIETASKPLLVVRQSTFNQIPLILLSLCFFAVSVWTSAIYNWATQTFIIAGVTVHLPMFGLIFLMLLVILLRRVYNTRLILCKGYLNHIKGLVSWSQKSIRIQYSDIKEIEIDQTIYQKLVGVGDVVITVMATSMESQINVPGVRNPRIIKDMLQEYRYQQEHSLPLKSIPQMTSLPRKANSTSNGFRTLPRNHSG